MVALFIDRLLPVLINFGVGSEGQTEWIIVSLDDALLAHALPLLGHSSGDAAGIQAQCVDRALGGGAQFERQPVDAFGVVWSSTIIALMTSSSVPFVLSLTGSSWTIS